MKVNPLVLQQIFITPLDNLSCVLQLSIISKPFLTPKLNLLYDNTILFSSNGRINLLSAELNLIICKAY